jgi:hypothetical protein
LAFPLEAWLRGRHTILRVSPDATGIFAGWRAAAAFDKREART